MVFKIKQRSIKDYDSYKKRQKLFMIKDRIKNIPGLIEAEFDNSLFESLTKNEIYGYNWPYDNFSLIEAIKIDTSFEM